MIRHRRTEAEDVDVFFRETGDRDAPALLLLHGFPASSYQYRGLIERLADRFRCVAPDLPGLGYTKTPSGFEYTFDHLAEVIAAFTDRVELEHYALYLFDWGAPVGFRLAAAREGAVDALIIQNGNAYKEGLSDRMLGLKAYWENREAVEPRIRAILGAEALAAQYREGAREPEAIPPDAATLDRHFIEQPGREQAILDLFYDYQHNVDHYRQWHEWLREERPPTLILWGENDPFFTVAGARAYLADVPDAELHLLETGHFALQEDESAVAEHIERFLGARTTSPSAAQLPDERSI